MKKTFLRFVSILLCFVFSLSINIFADTVNSIEELGISSGMETNVVIVRTSTGAIEEYSISSETSLFAPLVIRDFNWSIAPNSHTYSASSFYMNVGDKIYFTNVSYPASARVGLRNNANGTIANWSTMTSSNFVMEVLVAGTYHIAFGNTSSSTITVSGTFEVV